MKIFPNRKYPGIEIYRFHPFAAISYKLPYLHDNYKNNLLLKTAILFRDSSKTQHFNCKLLAAKSPKFPPYNFHLRTSPALDENRSTINRCSGFKKSELFSDAHLRAPPFRHPLSRFSSFLFIICFAKAEKLRFKRLQSA